MNNKAEEYKEKGNLEFKNKNFKEAINFYTKSIQIDPKSSIYYSNRALAYFQLKDFHNAKEDAKTSIEIDPKIIKPYVILSNTYIQLSENKNAELAIMKGLELDENNKQLRDNLDLIWSKSPYKANGGLIFSTIFMFFQTTGMDMIKNSLKTKFLEMSKDERKQLLNSSIESSFLVQKERKSVKEFVQTAINNPEKIWDYVEALFIIGKSLETEEMNNVMKKTETMKYFIKIVDWFETVDDDSAREFLTIISSFLSALQKNIQQSLQKDIKTLKKEQKKLFTSYKSNSKKPLKHCPLCPSVQDEIIKLDLSNLQLSQIQANLESNDTSKNLDALSKLSKDPKFCQDVIEKHSERVLSLLEKNSDEIYTILANVFSFNLCSNETSTNFDTIVEKIFSNYSNKISDPFARMIANLVFMNSMVGIKIASKIVPLLVDGINPSNPKREYCRAIACFCQIPELSSALYRMRVAQIHMKCFNTNPKNVGFINSLFRKQDFHF